MKYISSIVYEEPIVENDRVMGLDEDTMEFRLSDYKVDGLNRYAIQFERRPAVGDSAYLSVVQSISRLFSSKLTVVAGWNHDVDGYMRGTHRSVLRRFVKRNWTVHVEPEIGIGTIAIPAQELGETLSFYDMRFAGYFFCFGNWANTENLARDPFRNVISCFCRRHRLTPSLEFLEAVRECKGAFAYHYITNGLKPAIYLVSSRRLRRELEVR